MVGNVSTPMTFLILNAVVRTDMKGVIVNLISGNAGVYPVKMVLNVTSMKV